MDVANFGILTVIAYLPHSKGLHTGVHGIKRKCREVDIHTVKVSRLEAYM
jgi:hypothetical protein